MARRQFAAGLLLAGLLGGLGLAPLAPPAAEAAGKVVKFVTFGDFGTGAKAQYQVADAIAKKCASAGCDFAVTLGDNIYNDGVKSVSDPQFQTKFEKPFAKLPFKFYMALGNHDYRGNIQAQIDYTKRSKKWVMPARYYLFKQGPVTFFALDTNNPDARQRSFMQSQLHAATTPWKIVFGHHPRYTNGVYKNTQSAALKQLVDGFCGQAQLYLSGHEHDKQHLKPVCGIEHLIVGSAAGSRGAAEKAANTLFSSGSLGFAWVQASDSQIRFEILDIKGNVEHVYVLYKQ